MIRHLPHAQYTEMRWKNGQGITREVLRYPSCEQYAWRISLATIRNDGPFSRFPGYLRNISVLEGGGMYLTIDGQQSAFIPPFQATDFRGDSDVSCQISGGPLLDFNVIYDAATVRAAVRWVDGGEWAHHTGALLLFNAGDTLDIRVGEHCHCLHHYDSLLIDAPATVILARSAKNRVASVTLSPLPVSA
ncbi:HutD family protein [uncultured Klebsiella sp.]|uniref:HutD/Ves family protein n=1 Tax=uncultured Klebsiella sp. TaxID=284011 RepID=UPI002803F9FA|nr:HutD family protein [uncultured Klebsiella sp.]